MHHLYSIVYIYLNTSFTDLIDSVYNPLVVSLRITKQSISCLYLFYFLNKYFNVIVVLFTVIWAVIHISSPV